MFFPKIIKEDRNEGGLFLIMGGDAEKVDFYIAQISLKRLIPEKHAFH